jgi:membrane protein implicated in regulation of membrane protease activity
MPVLRRNISKTEKRFNYVLILAAKIVALVLAVLALGGFAIRAMSVESVVGQLTVALVVLALASMQDSLAINRICKELESLHEQQEYPESEGSERGN